MYMGWWQKMFGWKISRSDDVGSLDAEVADDEKPGNTILAADFGSEASLFCMWLEIRCP